MIRRPAPGAPLLAALMTLALLAACGREPKRNEAAFTPPADGRLTETQVERYLRKAPDGFRPRELDWVRARVQEARLIGKAGALDRRVVESRRRILRSLEERRQALKDPAKKAEADRRIAEIRRLLADAPPEPAPSVRDNAALIACIEERETRRKKGKTT